MIMCKRVAHPIRLWYLLWTTWSFLLLLLITLMLGASIHEQHFMPRDIYLSLVIVFFNGLVFSSIISFPSWVYISVESYLNLVVAILVGLAQWFFIYQLGKLWFLNWQNHRWYWKPLFSIFIIGYYAIGGSLSLYLLAVAVS